MYLRYTVRFLWIEDCGRFAWCLLIVGYVKASMSDQPQASKTCSECGFQAPARAAFCPKCGNSMQTKPTEAGDGQESTPNATPVAHRTALDLQPLGGASPSSIKPQGQPAKGFAGTMQFGAEMMSEFLEGLEEQDLDDDDPTARIKLDAIQADLEGATQDDLNSTAAISAEALEQVLTGFGVRSSGSDPMLATQTELPVASEAPLGENDLHTDQEPTSPGRERPKAPATPLWQSIADGDFDDADQDHTLSHRYKKPKPPSGSAKPPRKTEMLHPAKAPEEAQETGGQVMISGEFVAATEPLNEAGHKSMFISTDKPQKPQKPLNQTIVFGMEPPDEKSLEALAGGKLQASFSTDVAEHQSAPAASVEAKAQTGTHEAKEKAPSLRKQTIALEDVAAQMSEMARQSAASGGPPKSLSQTLSMDSHDINSFIASMGIDTGEDEEVTDATEKVTQAEKATDSGDYETAIEIYLGLLRSFPQETLYQERLEQVWAKMRENAIQEVVVQPSSSLPLLAASGLSGAVLLLLLLGFVWPGWFRSPPPPSRVVTPTPAPAPKPQTGTLMVNSQPSGAEVWLNGVPTKEQTPLTLERPAGTYQLLIKYKGFRSLRKTIQLKAGSTFAMEFALAPENDPGDDPPDPPKNRGTRRPNTVSRVSRGPIAFRVSSQPPGARISLNDKDTKERTPHTFKLKPGRYQIQLQREGYQTYIRDVRVASWRRAWRVNLIKLAGVKTRLSVKSKPSGAALSIDGKDTGKTTPTVLEVTKLSFTLALSKAGFQSTTRKLSLKKGEIKRLELRLSKKGPAGMIYVSGGPFWMGNNAGISPEKPMRRVTLRGFWIDRYEVSVAAYQECVSSGRCKAPSSGAGCNGKGKPSHPANCISWYDANRFCRWQKKRLPTEAEWEKAARGSSTQLYPWGHSAPSCRRAIFGRRCLPAGTSPVKSLGGGRSRYGLHHMSGNVWEWVFDFYDRNAYKKLSSTNPRNRFRGSGYKVIRGGAWSTPADQLHVTFRTEFWPSRRSNTVGFRCAR